MNRVLRIALPVCLGAFGCIAAWSFPFGPPAARTMAPGDRPGISCTQCHVGAAVNSGGGSVRVAFPKGLTYTPGEPQDLVLTVSDATAAIYGFEMTARPDNSPNTAPAGAFTAGTGQRIVCADNQVQPAGGCGGNGIQWIEHNTPSVTGIFNVRWTPPGAGAGNVHLYVSGNAANGDNTSRGDHIYSAEYVLVPASTATAGVPVVRSVGPAAGGGSAIQSCSWITITGSNFGTAAQTTWDKSIVDNVFPTTLDGVTVSINGKPAPLSFVSPTQINALAPLDSTVGPATVVVSNAAGSGATATAQLDAQSPGFFTFSDRYVAGLVLDSPTAFQYLAPAGSLGSGVQSRAAKAGDTILLYGTGFGRTTTLLNPSMSASVAYPLAHTGADITLPTTTVTIGGQPAQVTFAGLVGPGLYQLNVVVPQVAAGDQPVVLKLLSGGASTTQQVFIPVQ
jgi:uncharacterized protein (TIGR03437 family)